MNAAKDKGFLSGYHPQYHAETSCFLGTIFLNRQNNGAARVNKRIYEFSPP
jgi:hypothetical protein